MKLNVENLSLSHVLHLNADVRNKFLLQNRIKKFKQQINYHFEEKNYYPYKAKTEITRLKSILKYYLINYLIVNNSKIISIKKELNQFLTIRKHWEKCTGLEYIIKKPQLSILKRQLLDNLEKTSMNARRSQHIWRIVNELDSAVFNQYYVIFNTLTVASEYYNKVFDKGSKCFLNYKLKWDNIYGKDAHSYFCVIELGGETARHHYHVLHILKKLPVTWQTDPNYGMYQPYNRVIIAAQNMWEYGYSMPIAVRFSAFDAFAKLKWRWPYDRHIEGPLQESNPLKMAFYIAKYITKALTNKEPKPWKTKLNNQFGMRILNRSIQMMTSVQLKHLLIIAPMMVLRIHQTIIPQYFLMKLATKYLLLRHKNDSVSIQIMTLKARTSIMMQFNDLTRPTLKSKLPKCGFTEIKNSTKMAISDIQNIININTLRETGYVDTQQVLSIKGATIDSFI